MEGKPQPKKEVAIQKHSEAWVTGNQPPLRGPVMVLSTADLWLIFSKSRRKSETRECYVCVGEWRIWGLPSGSPILALVPRGRPPTRGWSSCTFHELPAFPRAEKAGPQVPASSAGAGARGGHPASSPPRPTCPRHSSWTFSTPHNRSQCACGRPGPARAQEAGAITSSRSHSAGS